MGRPAAAYVSWAARDSIAGMPQPLDVSPPNAAPAWKKRLLLPVVLALLAIAALWLDMPIAHYFLAKPWGGDLGKLVALCEAFGYAGTAALIMLAAATLDLRRWRVLPRLAISAFGAGLLADLVKLFIGRHRPLDARFVGETAWQTFTGWAGHQHVHLTQSFPSAHTATAAGLACSLSFFYPHGKWLFIALAMLTGLQRLHSNEHYLSDVLAGAALGSLIGMLATSKLPINNWLARIEEAKA